MSAYLVNDTHVDALLTYAQRPRYQSTSRYVWDSKEVVFYEHPDEIGQKLVDQNNASVNARYRENEPPPVYTFKLYPRPLSVVQVIKACDCWRYQSCENEGHEGTEAWTIVDQIRERAISELPGYEEADWEIEPV